MLRTLWRNNPRYLAGYWEKFQNRYYVAGDSAHRDKDGYFWIMGRIDDVLNVAGHRLGTMEIESALVSHPRVAEAAVVGRPHEIKGESVFAFVVCRGQRPTGDTSALVTELRQWVAQELGAIARPDDIRFADNLPKTRSGKIMRRLLRAIARGEEISQDVSTLENPAILEQLRGTESHDSPVEATRMATRLARGAKSSAGGRPATGKAPAAKAVAGKRARTSSTGRRATPRAETAGKRTARKAGPRPTAKKVSRKKRVQARGARSRSAARRAGAAKAKGRAPKSASRGQSRRRR
jgi:hypothetical protein